MVSSRTSASIFGEVTVAAPIEVFQMKKAYDDDSNDKKVNLSIGAYRDEQGKPWVLPVVREVEKSLAKDDSLNHEYLPILGFEPFTEVATKLLFGDSHVVIQEKRAFGVQSISGTGSLKVGAEFLHRILKCDVAYASKPTWENHLLLFRTSGYKEVREYRYWDNENRTVDFAGFLEDLNNAPENSVIILHGCAHNPTGMDLTHAQWSQICELIKRKKLIPLFDIAYQGFATGNLDEDAWAVRYFASQGLEMLVAQSFAKNFGLYNERVGNLSVVVADPNFLPTLKSQLTVVIRSIYSNPPAHGARIVHKILTDPNLKNMWIQHIIEMSARLKSMRILLREKLELLNTPGTWSHITDQIGMFSYTGLNESQVGIMINKYHIYMLKSGRISLAGLNKGNVDYVAAAIHDAVTSG